MYLVHLSFYLCVFQVNIIIAVLTFLVTIGIVVLSFYKTPATTGIGVAILVLGIPVYLLGVLCRRSAVINRVMGMDIHVYNVSRCVW
jgi:hypothetical protein